MREDYNLIELSKICTYSKGKKPKILTNGFSQSTPYPYINIKAFEKGIFDQYTDGEKCNLCKEGDLLMVWDGARSGYTGKAKRGAVGSTLMKIEPKQNIKKEYLFYFLLSLYIKLNTNPRGVGIPHVEPRLLWNSKIPLLSLPEQRDIVAKIEQLFSELDNGIANLKTAQEQLKVYRQAVLKKAFEDDWPMVIAEDVTEVITDGDHQAPPKSVEGVPFIVISNIKKSKIDFSNTKYVPTEYYQNIPKKKKPQVGDILYTVTGSYGKTVLIKDEKEFCFQRHIGLLRPNNKILPEYLYYILKSPSVKNQADLTSTGTAQKTVSLQSLRNFKFLMPLSKSEQHQIVQQIESRLSVCDKVEKTIAENLQKAEALRQSILKKAFAGELLTEAEIAACKKEKDWEPAGELLKRIKKEKLK
tara:strand:- start:167880 stop:169124 length:1245 start_codon:yes stop_codon:yes gene_type:complete